MTDEHHKIIKSSFSPCNKHACSPFWNPDLKHTYLLQMRFKKVCLMPETGPLFRCLFRYRASYCSSDRITCRILLLLFFAIVLLPLLPLLCGTTDSSKLTVRPRSSSWHMYSTRIFTSLPFSILCPKLCHLLKLGYCR